MPAATRSWKRQRMDRPLKPPEAAFGPANTLINLSETGFGFLASRTVREQISVVLKCMVICYSNHWELIQNHSLTLLSHHNDVGGLPSNSWCLIWLTVHYQWIEASLGVVNIFLAIVLEDPREVYPQIWYTVKVASSSKRRLIIKYLIFLKRSMSLLIIKDYTLFSSTARKGFTQLY